MCWKCVSSSSFQRNFVFFLRIGPNGCHNCDRLGVNFPKKCTDPKKKRNCFKLIGAERFKTTDVFYSKGE